MERFVLALDQGTTSSRAIVVDARGRVLERVGREFGQHYPREGWVEHDPLEIWDSQIAVAREVLTKSGITPSQIAAIGLANQRETTVLWDRETGKPVHNAIVWQCRRTAAICDELRAEGWDGYVRANTGLLLDAYFSAPKIQWLLANVPGLKERAETGSILFGTIDTWLLWNLTAGRVHATDHTNASRTMAFNIKTMTWDESILARLGIPRLMLPEVHPSSHVYGTTDAALFGGVEIPVAALAGDQQAALFGQLCFSVGQTKNTYGTGCFLMMNAGNKQVQSTHGLITTLACSLDQKPDYAIEGSVFSGGAVMQWLRDELGLIQSAADSEAIARSIPDTGGVYIVPAFTGLGAPYWDMYARGVLVGLTRGTNRKHLVRAGLEAIAYQTRDILEAVAADTGTRIAELKVDGGASVNDFLLQFQADLLGIPVCRPRTTETTALGAAFLAGLAVGFWKDRNKLAGLKEGSRCFDPAMEAEVRERLYRGWRRAVERSAAWIEP